MIYVRRDPSIIPQKLLDVAARAQNELEGKSPAERKTYIKKKSHIWRAFGRHLAKMSYGKCWYSESPDPQSFFDVDHFRPKCEARRSETEVDTHGYEWLAFSWENFRYAANCSNRISTNDETGIVDGKGSWFPLLRGSPKACWNSRCEETEKAILLDPVKQSDVDLIQIEADGRVGPSRYAVGSAILRVTRSCELYGLNLPGIKAARQRLMRDMIDMLEVLNDLIVAANNSLATDPTVDKLPISKQCDLIRRKTTDQSPYSRAARAALIREGCPEMCT